MAKFLKDNGSVNMEVDNHTDNSGAAVHNPALPRQRADAVKARQNSMVIDAFRLSTKGFGIQNPFQIAIQPKEKPVPSSAMICRPMPDSNQKKLKVQAAYIRLGCGREQARELPDHLDMGMIPKLRQLVP